jgi:hypothetical protein
MQPGFKSLREAAAPAGTGKPPVSNFDQMLIESVDQALRDLLGDRTRNQIYDYLSTHYNYGREEIPERIEDFYTFLENTFATGSRTVGRTIIRRLFTRLGYEYVNVPGFEFFDYLEAVRARVARDTAKQRLIQQPVKCTHNAEQ